MSLLKPKNALATAVAVFVIWMAMAGQLVNFLGLTRKQSPRVEVEIMGNKAGSKK